MLTALHTVAHACETRLFDDHNSLLVVQATRQGGVNHSSRRYKSLRSIPWRPLPWPIASESTFDGSCFEEHGAVGDSDLFSLRD